MARLFDNISLNAFDFRRNQSLSEIEPINCKSLLLKLNTLTLYRPLSENFSGMCLKKDGLTFILINSSHPRGKQHFTIAHELYHLFFQPDLKPHICNPGNLKEADINERLANAFAAELLMPKMGVIKMIPSIELSNKEISIPTVLKLENYFSVSHSSLVYRLSSLGLITKQQQDDLLSIRVKQTAQEYGFGLSLYQPGNEGCVIGDFGIKAKQLFTESRISESHYYELMNSIGIDPTLETNE